MFDQQGIFQLTFTCWWTYHSQCEMTFKIFKVLVLIWVRGMYRKWFGRHVVKLPQIGVNFGTWFSNIRLVDDTLLLFFSSANAIVALSTNFSIGFGSFVEKVAAPFVSLDERFQANPCRGTTFQSNCDAVYSYRHVISLTSNSTDFRVSVGTVVSTITSLLRHIVQRDSTIGECLYRAEWPCLRSLAAFIEECPCLRGLALWAQHDITEEWLYGPWVPLYNHLLVWHPDNIWQERHRHTVPFFSFRPRCSSKEYLATRICLRVGLMGFCKPYSAQRWVQTWNIKMIITCILCRSLGGGISPENCSCILQMLVFILQEMARFVVFPEGITLLHS